MNRYLAGFATALASLVLATAAQAKDPSEYGIQDASASLSTLSAGAHADFRSTVHLKTDAEGKLPSTTRDVYFTLPPGLLGNPGAVPTCTVAQLSSVDVLQNAGENGCPQSSQVGVTDVELEDGGGLRTFREPVYNMVPRYGEPARFGFNAIKHPIFIDTELRSDGDYGVTAKVKNQPSELPLYSADTTLWGVPADESHDADRITPLEAFYNNGTPDTPTGTRRAETAPVPFMANPTRCGVPLSLGIRAIPYMLPSLEATATAPIGQIGGCGLLDFKPTMTIGPTTSQAETGSGLDVDLTFPTDGFQQPHLRIGPAMQKAEVTLPEGVTVNPSQAVGLGVCSQADFERETASSLPNEGCPETSKIGSVTAKSPLLEETAEGGLYIAKPKENPFGTLIALYLVLKVPERGVIVKLPGKVVPDPETGQLITTFGEAGFEIPQLPVESFKLHFREGARAPLVTPPTCGTYESTAKFTAWSGQVVTTHPTFTISSGPNGGPCPNGTPPFEPGFTAKTRNLKAGAYSPFHMRLTRRDGDQDLTKFSSTLPPGLVAKLAGVSQCPEAAIEAAKARTGRDELASPSCPATSEVGNVLAGAGVGQVLTYATGKLYLAGPYQGAPISVAAIVPAVAGPFDVGTVVTRVALRLDPKTALVTVDGAASDPIPHILAGIPLKVRDIRVYVDRPDFTLNPTSCDPFAVGAEIWGGGNDVFSPADDSPVSRSSRFQAANCSLLRFKPKLTLRLRGGTKRADHPALTAILTPRPGDANIAGASAALPRSEFLENAHIRTVCTRAQFAAGACPAGAIYGRATATTPLLDFPVKGNVYLRSSDNLLPDLVADLRGPASLPIRFEVVGRTDSVNGGIRNTFDVTPDVPVTKFVLRLQGGRKGLLVNSRDICERTYRATVKFKAHNGKRRKVRPALKADCGKKPQEGKRRAH